MSGTARLMRSGLSGFRGDARLYRVSPAMNVEEGGVTEWVIASAIRYSDGECVTDVYPANESGEVTRWSSQATLWDQYDHEAALRVALPGYEVMAS